MMPHALKERLMNESRADEQRRDNERIRQLGRVVERLLFFKASILAKEFESDSTALRELFEDAEASLR